MSGLPIGLSKGKQHTERMINFVSLHIPKTAGTTFLRHVLKNHFEFVRTDYKRWPLKVEYPQVPKVVTNIVHGHFPASKYLDWEIPYITWIRDPIARMVSHYNYVTKGEFEKTGIRRKSFDTYIEDNVNVLTSYMDIPREKFVFVGVVERWVDSIKEFGRLTNTDLSRYISTEFLDSVDAEYAKDQNYVRPNPQQIRRMIDLNQKDIIFWKKERSNYD